MMVVNNFSKVRGNTKNISYPQPEGTLGEHMIRHGKDLGEDMMFGECYNNINIAIIITVC
jgi:endophilin-A